MKHGSAGESDQATPSSATCDVSLHSTPTLQENGDTPSPGIESHHHWHQVLLNVSYQYWQQRTGLHVWHGIGKGTENSEEAAVILGFEVEGW